MICKFPIHYSRYFALLLSEALCDNQECDKSDVDSDKQLRQI